MYRGLSAWILFSGEQMLIEEAVGLLREFLSSGVTFFSSGVTFFSGSELATVSIHYDPSFFCARLLQMKRALRR